ncbi:MAG: hypothetical protein F6K50_44715 [Moorea sp. SIO3I7]|nr:hypothetical protein [Moorena sp. SIO3I7]NEP27875.1 hypothetical protein [Moorena sp. SIO3I6]NEQ63858.1 hypothetical protein [Moorena sp. SIO4A1]
MIDIRLTEQQAYWQKRLSGELPVLQEFLSEPQLPVDTVIISREAFQLEQQLYIERTKFCSCENITLFTAIIAIFKIILLR